MLCLFNYGDMVMVKKRITVNQRKIVKSLLDNGTIPDGKGKSPSDAKIFNYQSARKAFREGLILLGIDEKTLAKNLVTLTKAQVVKHFQKDGIVVTTKHVADNTTRLAANALIGKYIGMDVQEVDMHHSGAIGGFDAMSELSDEELRRIESLGSPEIQATSGKPTSRQGISKKTSG